MSDLIPWRAGLEVGMGMNSFTRQIALEGAVEIEESEDKTFTQSVEYTHRQINSQSEMAKALNIAAPLAIANGGISSTSDGNFINKKVLPEDIVISSSSWAKIPSSSARQRRPTARSCFAAP